MKTVNTKRKALAAINDKGPKNTPTNRGQFNPKSTATEAQYHRIVKMLRTGTKTTFDFRRAGIMSPASRIKEMNDRHGFYIPTIALRSLWDDNAFEHRRVAVYELIDWPGSGYGKRA